MTMIDVLFGFQGRLNRAKYWLVLLIWLAIWFAVGAFVFFSGFSTASLVLSALVLMPSVWSGIAVGIKRLHDRDKTGWWLLLFYLAPILLDALARSSGGLGIAFSIPSLAISIWAIVELGFLRGTIGGNAYGPDPVAPKLAEH
jgi:uncharacterized membrane protein YhaH (DUF805 family)